MTAILITALLAISAGATMTLIPTATAHTPGWEIPTYAYIVAAPNPIGVGQTQHIYMWLDCVFGAAGGTSVLNGNVSAVSAALLQNNYRFHNYHLTITAPDGTVTTQTFDVISDSTSSEYTKFVPTQVGTYTLNFTFPGQAYAEYEHYEKSSLINDTYSPSSASTTFVVQQQPIPDPINSYPLPVQYWTHPIYGENTDWWTISSNWLGLNSPAPGGSSTLSSSNGPMYRNDAVGPQTPHVMWTRPLQFGGVVGGNPFLAGGSNPNGAVQGVQYYEGSSYTPRFVNPIIINGYLFYTEPVSFTGTVSGPTDAIDLRTGQVLWSRTDVPALSFGYIYNEWNPDQHGTFPPILFTNNFAQAFDAYTGDPMFNVTGVPSGTSVMGPSGEILRYVFTNIGTATNPYWILAQWNSSRLWQWVGNPYPGGGTYIPSVINASNGLLIGAIPVPITGTSGTTPTGGSGPVPYGSSIIVNANVPLTSTNSILSTYDWNTTVPFTGSSATVLAADYGDIMVCMNGSLPSGFAQSGSGTSQGPFTFFAVNLNASKGAIGQILWTQTFNPPTGNLTLVQGPFDFQNRVFTFNYVETQQWAGYSMDTGKYLWTTSSETELTPFNYYDWRGYNPGVIAYGNLYSGGFGGVLYAFNDLTGEIEWTYGNGGEGNSTNAGLNVFYGNYPSFVQAIGNGVVYFVAEEHTIPNPLYKGTLARALNATTGQEIWTLSGYDSTWAYSGSEWAIADGYATMMNGLDNNIYSVGRGPSALTVSASKVQTIGENVVVDGTVTDISAGTKQTQQAADFPNGVPVASDASMKDWMGYVYQQKPLPTNFTGVDVSIDVLDSNGNFRNIGTATTDTNGYFTLTWTPDITGNYEVIATFAGTNGYWRSTSETSFNVMDAHATPTPTTALIASNNDTYIMGSAIIIVVVIVGSVIVLMQRKRP